MGAAAGPDIVEDGLVLCLDAANERSYPGSGNTWYDLSGNGNDGTLVNGVGYSSDNNRSMVFDGVDDYVDIGFINSQILTMSFIFKRPTSFNDEDGRFLLYSPTASSVGAGLHLGGWTSQKSGETFKVSTYGFSNNIDFNTSINGESNKWYHFAASWDGVKYQLYLNGLSIHTQSETTSAIIQGNLQWFIGAGVNLDYRYHNGNISNVQIYNRALTEAEIKQNFEATRSRYGI